MKLAEVVDALREIDQILIDGPHFHVYIIRNTRAHSAIRKAARVIAAVAESPRRRARKGAAP